MRHRNSGRRFGRNSSHRKAMFRNMVMALLEHGQITTTQAKGKELRKYVEKVITLGTSLGDLITKPQDDLTPEEKAKVLHHYRLARHMIPNRQLLTKLFREIAPLYLGRPGGYTRIIKASMNRRGDNAPVALISLIDYDKLSSENNSEGETEE